jgi:hypothetical protein
VHTFSACLACDSSCRGGFWGGGGGGEGGQGAPHHFLTMMSEHFLPGAPCAPSCRQQSCHSAAHRTARVLGVLPRPVSSDVHNAHSGVSTTGQWCPCAPLQCMYTPTPGPGGLLSAGPALGGPVDGIPGSCAPRRNALCMEVMALGTPAWGLPRTSWIWRLWSWCGRGPRTGPPHDRLVV